MEKDRLHPVMLLNRDIFEQVTFIQIEKERNKHSVKILGGEKTQTTQV